MYGCDEPVQFPVVMAGEEYYRCPLRPLYENPDKLPEIIWYYRSYNKGFLPVEGGLLDQPHKLLSCIKVIDKAYNMAEAEKAEKEELARKRKQSQTNV